MEIYDWLMVRKGSPEGVTEALRSRGITHVLRYEDALMIDPSHWAWAQSNCDLLWHQGDVSIFALR